MTDTNDFTQQDADDERETANVYEFILATTDMPAARANAMTEIAARHRARAVKIEAHIPAPRTPGR